LSAYNLDGFNFEDIWFIIWSVVGAFGIGFFYDLICILRLFLFILKEKKKLENGIAGQKPKVFAGFVVLGINFLHYLLYFIASLIADEKPGEAWEYVLTPFFTIALFGSEVLI
jgi:hypothetical protein